MFFARPGLRTSEFLIAVATVLWYVLNAAADWYSTGHAVELSAPAVAFIISRGLAKYETRATVASPPTPPVA